MQLDIPSGDFDGYVFDLDGTLIDTMPLHFLAWSEAMKRAGLPVPLSEDLFYSLGGVPTQELVSLYQRAAAVVFPSLYEGFGLPPLESLACGCPVAASKYIRNAPPPILEDCGSTRPSTVWATTSASAAVPPSRSASHAASVEIGLAVETANSPAFAATIPSR